MYYYLKGTIVEKNQSYIVVDVLGVGYQVYIVHEDDFPLFEQKMVYLYHVVREDEEYFVGFPSLKEKDIFVKLISCKGIGPKTAINALRDVTYDEFLDIISSGDVKRLKKLNGIGAKEEAQILLDLKGTLSLEQIDNAKTKSSLNKNQELAKEALESLGFKAKQIEEAFNKINNQDLTLEDYIKEALKIM